MYVSIKLIHDKVAPPTTKSTVNETLTRTQSTHSGISKCAGTSVARYCMAFMMMSSGMYFASTSFLPNTLSMHLTMIAFAAWFCDHYKLTIFAAGMSILVGWPYAAIV